MTPTELSRLIQPIWDKRPEARPHLRCLPLTLLDVTAIHDSKTVYSWYYHGGSHCDDQTAAERIEFGVNMVLEAEAEKRGEHLVVEKDGDWFFIACGGDDDRPRAMDKNRLIAKIKLAYALLGIAETEDMTK